MKKNLIAFVGLLTLAVFAGSVMAQGQTKPVTPATTEKQGENHCKSTQIPLDLPVFFF